MSLTRAEELKKKRREVQDRLKTVENQIKLLSAGLVSTDMTAVDDTVPSTEESRRLEAARQRIIKERSAVDTEIEFLHSRIQRLRFWLTIESIGGVSVTVLVWGPFFFLSWMLAFLSPLYWYIVLIAAAAAFLPFLVASLIRMKKFNWLWLLTGMVGLPGLVNLIAFASDSVSLFLELLALLMFYAFCGLLRWSIDEWLEYL